MQLIAEEIKKIIIYYKDSDTDVGSLIHCAGFL